MICLIRILLKKALLQNYFWAMLWFCWLKQNGLCNAECPSVICCFNLLRNARVDGVVVWLMHVAYEEMWLAWKVYATVCKVCLVMHVWWMVMHYLWYTFDILLLWLEECWDMALSFIMLYLVCHELWLLWYSHALFVNGCESNSGHVMFLTHYEWWICHVWLEMTYWFMKCLSGILLELCFVGNGWMRGWSILKKQGT